MSWDNPVSPIDAKNSFGFLVPFFWGQPGLLGDSVYNQDVLLFKLMTFWGVLLTEACYCLRLHGKQPKFDNNFDIRRQLDHFEYEMNRT